MLELSHEIISLKPPVQAYFGRASARVFAILILATVEDWGEEIFPEGVGVNWKKWARLICTYPLPVKHPRWRHRKLY